MRKRIHNFLLNHYNLKYKGIYQQAKKLFAFDLALLAIAVVMLGASLFFFFWKPSLVDLIDLSISFGTERLESGQTTHLLINYTNRTKVNLENSVLAVHLPPGFIIDRTKTPESEFSANSIFNLGTIPPGAKGQKEIWGQMWIEPQIETRLPALLSYQVEKTNRKEQKSTLALVKLPDSIIDVTVNISTTSFSNQTLPVSINLTNTSAEPIDGIGVEILNWSGRIIADGQWDKIKLGAFGTTTFFGYIVAPTTGGKTELVIKTSVTVNDKTIVQSIKPVQINILQPKIEVSAKVASDTIFVEPGQILPVEIEWKNIGVYTLKNIKLRLSTTPGVVDLARTAKNNGGKVVGQEIIFEKNTFTALAESLPNQSDKKKIELTLLPHFSLGAAEQVKLEIKPIISAELVGINSDQSFIKEGTTANLPIATEVGWRIESRYYTPEGDQLGRGPLPPMVGETTKYWIFARIDNTTNALDDIKFSAAIPNGVQFTGKQSVSIGPPLVLDNKTKTASWSHYRIPPHSTTGIYFEVSVTPGPDQIEKNILLLKDARFTASDNWIEKQYSLSSNGVDNILPTNDLGASAGSNVVAIIE